MTRTESSDEPLYIILIKLGIAALCTFLLVMAVHVTGVEEGRTLERNDIIKYCELEEVFADRGVILTCKVIKSKLNKSKLT